MTEIEKFSALFAKCVEINGLESHNHENSNSPNVFLSYSGHVAQISIEWFINGWWSGARYDGKIEFYTKDVDQPCWQKHGMSYFEYAMSELENLQNHTCEVALDADLSNYDAIENLNTGDVFLLKTPIDTVARGVVIERGGKKRYQVSGLKPKTTEYTFGAIKRYMEYLRELKRA